MLLLTASTRLQAVIFGSGKKKGFNPDNVEKQLVHQLKDSAEAAYNRAEYAEPRRKMMQGWDGLIIWIHLEVRPTRSEIQF
jgi:hypothetical protein